MRSDKTGMNAIELLEAQHGEVMEVLRQLKSSSVGAEREASFSTMQQSLFAHMAIEEDVLYPALMIDAARRAQIASGYQDHAGARRALRRCTQVLHRESLFQICIGVLSDVLEQHIADERRWVFPQALATLDAGELEELGRHMKTRFDNATRSLRRGDGLDRNSPTRTLGEFSR